MAEWSYGSLADLYDLAAVWKACRREDSSGDHHGLDLGDGLEEGVLVVTRAFTLPACVSNQSSKTDTGQERGGGGGTGEGSWGRIASHLVLDQLGAGAGRRNLGKEKEITTGTWSEPVEGRGVSQPLKAGNNGELAKARSRSEGLREWAKGKYV